jgi:sec-independent protein translocase protein TatA
MGLDNPLHIAFLLVILLLVFGAKRLPEMGRSLGSGLRGFKDSINGPAPADELSSPSSVVAHEPVAAPTPVAEPVAEPTPFRPVA